MIPTQPFGSTEHNSTRTIFGAAALGRMQDDEAAPILELLLKHGVNHIDTAAGYGRSERRVGTWMEHHRDDFFLATKTGERTYKGARDQFHHSLERLRVDSVDLLQLHNLVDPKEWRTALGPDGALAAAVEAREEGLVRFIGVTGHGVTVAAMHLQSLERFAFDSVLLPYSYVMMQNPQYAADFETLATVCAERGVAMQTIKGITLRPWDERGRIRADARRFFGRARPYVDAVSVRRAPATPAPPPVDSLQAARREDCETLARRRLEADGARGAAAGPLP
ncbi:MAG: aldo/keto reductase [Chloroflexi bacterium]|nr:aldo/keto reductase [Chloroflexota bacterium]